MHSRTHLRGRILTRRLTAEAAHVSAGADAGGASGAPWPRRRTSGTLQACPAPDQSRPSLPGPCRPGLSAGSSPDSCMRAAGRSSSPSGCRQTRTGDHVQPAMPGPGVTAGSGGGGRQAGICSASARAPGAAAAAPLCSPAGHRARSEPGAILAADLAEGQRPEPGMDHAALAGVQPGGIRRGAAPCRCRAWAWSAACRRSSARPGRQPRRAHQLQQGIPGSQRRPHALRMRRGSGLLRAYVLQFLPGQLADKA